MFEHDLTDPHDVGLNAERLAAIPEYFQQNYIDRGKLPCVATLVSRGGEVALVSRQDKNGVSLPRMCFPVTSVATPMSRNREPVKTGSSCLKIRIC